MKTDNLSLTGYNPSANSFASTPNENVFWEDTSVKDCTFSQMKDAPIIIERITYPAQIIYTQESKKVYF